MTIFNPYVILGFVLAMGTAFSGGYYKGKDSEYKRQQLEIAKLNSQARQKELALTTAVTQTATALRTSNEKAKQISKERDLAISSGALRLRLPAKATYCPVQAPTDDTPAPRDSGEREPNLTQRLLELLSPSQSQETKQSDNSQPVSKPINPLTTP
jgi:hypothetical protein